LLAGLSNQVTGGSFRYSVVVVDNDRLQSARTIVSTFGEKSLVDITYVSEPEKNISLARNRAVQNARGIYLALIDDDEFPGEDWLLNLYNTCKMHNADGVLGPVIPQYEVEPPEWVVKGGLHCRKEFRTGTILRNSRDTRTGNVLLAMRIFNEVKSPFDVRYGRSGGEDTEYFRRMMGEGRVFVWCNEAPVYETVPPERMKRSYFLRRALLRGTVSGRSQSFSVLGTSKSILAFFLYTLSLPFLQLAGHHLFMKYLVKSCDHIGKILATFGINIVEERT
jgi:glycosyltransferase involved in cell wall biosynthesis